MRLIHTAAAVTVLFALAFTGTLFATDGTSVKRRTMLPEELNAQAWMPHDPIYDGKALSYWLAIIRQRDEKLMPLAFDALRNLGPEAWPAVPELARIITAPFSVIRVGKDSRKLIASKVQDIQIRSEAIDTLVCIGEDAASATVSLVRWALTSRVTAPVIGNREDLETFVGLMTIDIAHRMQVVNAIVAFGDAATPAVERLLWAPDDETRRLAVAILGADALVIAVDLLKSPDCEDRQLGITMLKDMELIVPREHLSGLSRSFTCEAN